MMLKRASKGKVEEVFPDAGGVGRNHVVLAPGKEAAADRKGASRDLQEHVAGDWIRRDVCRDNTTAVDPEGHKPTGKC
jgi:hypothetical protein